MRICFILNKTINNTFKAKHKTYKTDRDNKVPTYQSIPSIIKKIKNIKY